MATIFGVNQVLAAMAAVSIEYDVAADTALREAEEDVDKYNDGREDDQLWYLDSAQRWAIEHNARFFQRESEFMAAFYLVKDLPRSRAKDLLRRVYPQGGERQMAYRMYEERLVW